ncbi:efflux RND transporter periplasmic adaptor subunit [Fannyhessea vaginae]|uniref:efflux RND transporter periplasmic adaptor subunit n=1 Tax=Fannyhessea vaginae TaxID=82135 RepID=UPI0023F1B33A|nr:efflux RND transporter periplasmic adaptor subunit [Fannyhessea vaginae]
MIKKNTNTVPPLPQNNQVPAQNMSTLKKDEADANQALNAIMELRKKKRRKNKIIGLSILGICVLFIIAGVVGSFLSKSHNSAQDAPLATVEKHDFTSTIKTSGTAEPVSNTVVTPEVDGIIDEVRVNQGANVKKGDVLFTIKNDTLDKAVQTAQNQLNVAKKQVKSARDAYSRAYASYRKALNEYNSAPSAEVQKALPNPDTVYESVASAQSAIDQAKLAADQAQSAVDEAREKANKRTVVAPCDGNVITMNAKRGAAVGSLPAGMAGSIGQNPENGILIQIADLSKMRVRLSVSEIDISGIKLGQQAKVTFSALPGVTCDAVVENIASTAENAAVSPSQMGAAASNTMANYAVDVLIDKPHESIKCGMTADVEIVTQEVKNALVVPTSCIVEEDGTSYVYVLDDNHDGNAKSFTKQAVNVIARSGSQTAIEGVAEGTSLKRNASSDDSSSQN